ncbi:cytochrome P450 [Dentipellis sp. KUC8613]|nr:cytochrome P450 [Dentipellis sp. KUC8613]
MSSPTLIALRSFIDNVQSHQRLGIIATIGIATILLQRYIRSPYRKLPPGPVGLPIIGNLLSLIGRPQLVTFSEWKQTYGDLTYITVAGQRLLVINSCKAAIELLDRRSGNTSSRPRNIVAFRILSGENMMVLMENNTSWRQARRAAHEALNKDVAHQYHPIQMTEGVLLAADVLASPKDWNEHFQRRAASLIMSMVYDHPPITNQATGHPILEIINAIINRFLHAAKPGTYLVEFFPWMMYIPRCLAKWRTDAEEHCRKDTMYFESLVSDVKKRMVSGTIRDCFTTNLVENASLSRLTCEGTAWLAGTMYIAGSETSANVMAWFLLSMLLYPDAQNHAQKELDTVVGRSRIPTFADLNQLPYIQALVKEVLRWRSPSLFAAPHTTSSDDWYEGMFIPKGTSCLPNIWVLNNDPELFGPDATSFNPARYLDESGQLNTSIPVDHFSFGFGRRVCVGQHVANNSLFIDIAMLLWATKIERVTDTNGDLIPLDADGYVEEGLAVHPLPFDCKIVPRFPEASLILESEKELRGV